MENKEVVKHSDINIKVGLNSDNVPVEIKWEAEDNPQANSEAGCKGMMLSLFDKESRDTLKIDLWTTEMQVMEMDRFFYQTLRGMADTYFKATQNQKLSTEMQKFVQYFGEETEILTKK